MPVYGTMEERIAAVERVTKLFRAERLAYLFATGLALALLFFNTYLMMRRGGGDNTAYAVMFGSGGMITYSTGQLINMWKQALRVIGGEKLGPAK